MYLCKKNIETNSLCLKAYDEHFVCKRIAELKLAGWTDMETLLTQVSVNSDRKLYFPTVAKDLRWHRLKST